MKNVLCMAIVMLFALSSSAQKMKILPDSLYSENLKEVRHIEVELPDDYDPASPKKYEVIYVTDGEWNNDIVAHMQRFVQIQFIPPCIVVSMKNQGVRERDFTNGSDHFLAFMKSELMPYIEKKYPARADNRTYVGSSLAGLFGMYIFLKDPQVFQSYLISDPAMWWKDGALIKETGEQLASMHNIHASLYITGREGHGWREMGVYDLDSIFKAKAPASLHWKIVPYANETHNSMIFKTVYDGLKFTWAGYTTDKPVYIPETGVVLKDKAFKLFIWPDERSDWHYTTDGSTPTAASPRVEKSMDVTIPVQLNIKAICTRDEYSQTVNGNFTVGHVLPAAPLAKQLKSGGLDSLKGQLSGMVKVDKEGYYIFYVAHCDSITIGNQVFAAHSIVVPLQKGYYPFKVAYTGDTPGIEWFAPDAPDSEKIPLTALYHHSIH